MNAAYYLNDLGAVCAVGSAREEVARRMFAADSGVLPSDRFSPGRPLPIGMIASPLPSLATRPIAVRSRNNQLALAAAEQLRPAVEAAINRYGPSRVAVVVGTSTSGIGESESAIREYVAAGALPTTFVLAQQELGSVAAFLSQEFGTRGPAFVHSSACASGAKAMASAARLLGMGLADAVITGGVDSLCAFTVAGFASLNLVSETRCNPFSANRDGINIGEAAALFLMTREPATVRLLGWGESSDGHHFSAPDPSGRGAALAINAALLRAQRPADAVEYVNLHATGSKANDEMEGAVVHTIFGDAVAMSGTKPLTGHTLGAAGAIEAAICWLTMQDSNRDGFLPPHLWDGAVDASIPALHHVVPGERLGRPPSTTLSTSFAFGGANAALVFGREQ